MFVGSARAVISGRLRGVYFSKTTLISDAGASLVLKSKSIRRLAKKPMGDIISYISKHRLVALDEAILNISNKKTVYVLHSAGQPSSSNTVRLLASRSAQSGKNIVICDTTGQSEKIVKDKPTKPKSELPILSIEENISVLSGTVSGSFFTSKTFSLTIKDLEKQFDQVFVCTNYRDAKLGLTALVDFNPGLVVISSLRKTKKSDIKFINSKQQIDLLFHD